MDVSAATISGLNRLDYEAVECYFALSTDIGVTRTALSAGSSVPANAVTSVTATALAKVVE